MTTSPTKSINDLSRIYLTQVSEKKENPYSIKNKLKMAIKSVAEKERMKAGVTREEVENIDEKCWDGYEKKGMKTMFGKRYPNCVKKKAKKEDFSNWRDDLSDIVEVMDMTDDKAEKKIDDKKTVKNKVIINPKLSEAVKDMGGELLEVTEIEEGDGDPCWDSHKQVGMKKKGNKMVPNCVPKNEETQIGEAKVDQGRSDYGKASIRNYRRMGPGHDDPGMFDPSGKRGKTIDKRREEHKARRGVKGAKVPAYKVEETEHVDEAKVEGGYISNVAKAQARNERRFGDKGSTEPTGRTGQGTSSAATMAIKRGEEHKARRGVKTKGMKEEVVGEGVKGADPEMRKMAAQDRRSGIEKRLSKKAGERNVANMTRKIEQGREMAMAKAYEEVELTEVKDKKGKGSGTKDACYHKVKSRYSVWPSAYASGALVKCRKVGAANWGNSKKESFSDWRSEFIWEDGDSEKKLTEDDMKGMSVKSGHKRPTKSGAGMTQKGVEAYRRRNPGSKLKTAVTTKPSKLKKGSKAANRRKSYCARSAGQMKKFPKAAKDPNSRLRQARRRWNC